MEEEWDWDLQAVVRSCSGGGATTRKDPPFFIPQPFQLSGELEEEQRGEKDEKRSGGELELLYKPFFPRSSSEMIHLLHHHHHQQQQQKQSTSSSAAISLLNSDAGLTPAKQQQQQQQQRQVSTTRSKRRKNQQKKVVCQIPADGLSSDMWAWRKYGQKPIKGSPYPRGYYRCSTSKGCLARKQVERNKLDPNIFIVTYTADHNHAMPTHRNSLAGSTRLKFPTSNTSATTTTPAPIDSAGTGGTRTGVENRALPEYPTSYMSPNTPMTSTSMEEDVAVVAPAVKKEEADEMKDEGTLLISDMEVLDVDDIFFLGLEDLHQPNNFQFSSSPWHTTAAAGGS